MIQGFSEDAISRNIASLIKEGKSPKQAKAIAEATARKAQRQQMADGGEAQEPLKANLLGLAMQKAGVQRFAGGGAGEAPPPRGKQGGEPDPARKWWDGSMAPAFNSMGSDIEGWWNGSKQDILGGGVQAFQAYGPGSAPGGDSPGVQASNARMGAADAQGQEIYGQQGALAGQLRETASGRGPSMADMQNSAATQRNINSAASMAASARGVNPALAARMAGEQAAGANQQAAGQAMMGRLAEQKSAQEQLGNLYGQQATAANQRQGIWGQQYGQNMSAQMGAQEINAKTNSEERAADQGYLGTVLGGIGQIFEGGGAVPDEETLDDKIKKYMGALDGIDTLTAGPEVQSQPALHMDEFAYPEQAKKPTLASPPEQSVSAPTKMTEDEEIAPYKDSSLSPLSDQTTPAYDTDLAMAGLPQSATASSGSAGMGYQKPYTKPEKKTDTGKIIGGILGALLGVASVAARRSGATKIKAFSDGGDSDDGYGESDSDINTKAFTEEEPEEEPEDGGGLLGMMFGSGGPGGRVPGSAPFPTVSDTTKNDVVPAVLSPGEIVLPRSVTKSEHPEERAAGFVLGVKSTRAHPLPQKPTLEDMSRMQERMQSNGMASGGAAGMIDNYLGGLDSLGTDESDDDETSPGSDASGMIDNYLGGLDSLDAQDQNFSQEDDGLKSTNTFSDEDELKHSYADGGPAEDGLDEPISGWSTAPMRGEKPGMREVYAGAVLGDGNVNQERTGVDTGTQSVQEDAHTLAAALRDFHAARAAYGKNPNDRDAYLKALASQAAAKEVKANYERQVSKRTAVEPGDFMPGNTQDTNAAPPAYDVQRSSDGQESEPSAPRLDSGALAALIPTLAEMVKKAQRRASGGEITSGDDLMRALPKGRPSLRRSMTFPDSFAEGGVKGGEPMSDAEQRIVDRRTADDEEAVGAYQDWKSGQVPSLDEDLAWASNTDARQRPGANEREGMDYLGEQMVEPDTEKWAYELDARQRRSSGVGPIQVRPPMSANEQEGMDFLAQVMEEDEEKQPGPIKMHKTKTKAQAFFDKVRSDAVAENLPPPPVAPIGVDVGVPPLLQRPAVQARTPVRPGAGGSSSASTTASMRARSGPLAAPSLATPVAEQDPVQAYHDASKDMVAAINSNADTVAKTAMMQAAALEKAEAERRIREQNFAEVQKRRQQELDDLSADIRNSDVDPARLWDSKSTGEKVLASIGIMFGAMAQGLQGLKSNPVVDMINRKVDQDIEAQKSNISKKQSLYRNYLDATGSELAAEQYARADMLAATGVQMQMIGYQQAGDVARSGAQYALAELAQAQQQAEAKGRQAENEWRLKVFKEASDAAEKERQQAEIERHNRATEGAAWMRASASRTAAEAKAGSGGQYKMEALVPVKNPNGGTVIARQERVARDKDSFHKAQKIQGVSDKFTAMLNEYIRLSDENPHGGYPAGEDAARLKAMKPAIMFELSLAQEQGVIRGGKELEMYNQMVPDASDFRLGVMPQYSVALKTLRDTFKAGAAAKMKPLFYAPGDVVAPADDDAPAAKEETEE